MTDSQSTRDRASSAGIFFDSLQNERSCYSSPVGRKGEDTRAAIVETALGIASVDGLDALAIGPLAQRMGMSKSGLFAHFKSKESLQLRVLERGVERFVAEVVAPALRAPRGLPRVQGLFDNWLAWDLNPEYPGGCVFLGAATDFDDRPGPLRDFVARAQREWITTLARAATISCNEGHFHADLDTEQFAFEIYGTLMAFNFYHRLLADPRASDRARHQFEDIIARAATHSR